MPSMSCPCYASSLLYTSISPPSKNFNQNDSFLCNSKSKPNYFQTSITKKFNLNQITASNSLTSVSHHELQFICTSTPVTFDGLIIDAEDGGKIWDQARPEPRFGVVITGATRGLGYFLAREFLKLGDSVFICGRSSSSVTSAINALKTEFPEGHVSGLPCDVSDYHQVDLFAEEAKNFLKTIHFWINNAGQVTSKKLLADVDPDEIVQVAGTNYLGSLIGSRAAVNAMKSQQQYPSPQYHIFNLGFSKWGAYFTRSACTHKSSKLGVTQITDSLNEELRNSDLPHIGVHNLSPGMVLTDLLLKDSTPIARRFFNTLAEEPETVAAFLVPKIRSIQGSGNGIEYLSPLDAITRVITGFPQIINGGRFFNKEGNRVQKEGAVYQSNGVRLPY